jgi:transposase-like protein
MAKRTTKIQQIIANGFVHDAELQSTAPSEWLAQLELEFHGFVTETALQVMQGMMDAEVERLCGERYARAGTVSRWGSQPGSVRTPGGEKLRISRPRLRRKEDLPEGSGKAEVSHGHEEPLETYRRFHEPPEHGERLYASLVHGISTRDYARTVERVATGYGLSKSAVSSRMIAQSAETLRAFCERDLSGVETVAVLIDGVQIGQWRFIVALSVDSNGLKQVLGLRQGATENAQVTIELFEDLVRRGWKTDHPMLAVIDGSKALRAAVQRFLGEKTPVQRCQEHKIRNVTDHLPQRLQEKIESRMRTAYELWSYEDARIELEKLRTELEEINPAAAASLTEGRDETLTMQRLAVPDALRRTLRTTNVIESLFSMSARYRRNVKRWTNARQAERWIGISLAEAEKRFHRIRGYKDIHKLIKILNSNVEPTPNKTT